MINIIKDLNGIADKFLETEMTAEEIKDEFESFIMIAGFMQEFIIENGLEKQLNSYVCERLLGTTKWQGADL